MPKGNMFSQNVSRMTALNVIRYSDGRTYYPCGRSAIPPTNPKVGPPALSNTVLWNGRTRIATLVIPRQNPVNIDSWAPQSHLRSYSGPVTYEKPPFRQLAMDTVIRRSSVNDPCQTTPK